jgi:hypothetical protein
MKPTAVVWCAEVASRRDKLTAMNYRRVLELLLFAGLATGQSLDCIADMTVPRYNLSSRRSITGGDVTATVTVGAEGHAAKIDLVATDPNLAEEVRLYLTNETKYSNLCQGKKIEVKFTFQLEGEPEWAPPVWVRFRPPNHFVIVSRPQKPIVN